jgi:hypothetical protein
MTRAKDIVDRLPEAAVTHKGWRLEKVGQGEKATVRVTDPSGKLHSTEFSDHDKAKAYVDARAKSEARLMPRDAAQQGKYVVRKKSSAGEPVKAPKVGDEVDWYHKDTGDKFNARVHSYDGKKITLQAAGKDGTWSGKKHTYDVHHED